MGQFFADYRDELIARCKAKVAQRPLRTATDQFRTLNRCLARPPSGALANILQNAFKFMRPGTEVTLTAYATGERVFIDVADHCDGLPAGQAEKMFRPFSQRSADKTGLGLGLTIVRQSLEANSGTISGESVPGTGCVFSMRLPRRPLG